MASTAIALELFYLALAAAAALAAAGQQVRHTFAPGVYSRRVVASRLYNRSTCFNLLCGALHPRAMALSGRL
jgi:hypothetical protein